MTRLRSEQVLKDNMTQDSSAISTLKLNHKALSDVSCLIDFKNLERLDLTFNNLTSLEPLKSCSSLKWLSVVQNKLESLKGIEGLSKLTVLNAGKNKLKSMDEARSLVSLCALILNDNEIVSICKLDQMKNLNTLVLSRNPIRDIGESLMKVKSIKKLSLSNCKLQSIDSSLKPCVELKELRLAHNDIQTLPADLAHNKKLQNLDLGNNVITRWSDLKVLSALVNLRNLNLQGNPVAVKPKIANKVGRFLPNLQIFNGRPLVKYKNEKGNTVDKVDDSSFNKLEIQKGKERDQTRDKFEHNVPSLSKDAQLDYELDPDKKSKRKREETNKDVPEKLVGHEDERRAKKTPKKALKAEKNEKMLKNPKEAERGKLDIIDDAEASFADLFDVDDNETLHYKREDVSEKAVDKGINLGSNLVTFPAPAKGKKNKNHGRNHDELQLSPVVEVGNGGPSTWGDE